MATGKVRLTGVAHREIRMIVAPGDIVIDATAGNGHDTLFLAGLVGHTGRVYAFDIQAEALEHTCRRLAATGLGDQVTLLQLGHEQLCGGVPPALHGRIAAVMFNLGYLPGSDRRCITRAGTTLAALDQAMTCLRPGGILSVIAYPGHAGGGTETEAVQHWLRRHAGAAAQLREIRSPGDMSPVLFLSRLPDRGAAS